MLRRAATGPERRLAVCHDLQAAPSWRCAPLRSCPPSQEGGWGSCLSRHGNLRFWCVRVVNSDMNTIKCWTNKLADFLMPEAEPAEGDLIDYTKEFVDKRISQEMSRHGYHKTLELHNIPVRNR